MLVTVSVFSLRKICQTSHSQFRHCLIGTVPVNLKIQKLYIKRNHSNIFLDDEFEEIGSSNKL